MNAKQMKPEPIEIDVDAALEELKWLGLAVCTDATRFAITRVVVLDTDAVATDGHRLHWINGSTLPGGFQIRGTEVDLLLTLSKTYKLERAVYHGDFTMWYFESPDGSAHLRFNIVDSAFPEWKRVLPRDGETVELATKDIRKKYVGEGVKPDFSIVGPGHFNARYIADALNGAPKRVNVTLPVDKESPVLFQYDNRGAVVMPVRQ